MTHKVTQVSGCSRPSTCSLRMSRASDPPTSTPFRSKSLTCPDGKDTDFRQSRNVLNLIRREKIRGSPDCFHCPIALRILLNDQKTKDQVENKEILVPSEIYTESRLNRNRDTGCPIETTREGGRRVPSFLNSALIALLVSPGLIQTPIGIWQKMRMRMLEAFSFTLKAWSGRSPSPCSSHIACLLYISE
jgi:hypothetical protein